MESHSASNSEGENTTTLPDGARFNYYCRQPQGEAFLTQRPCELWDRRPGKKIRYSLPRCLHAGQVRISREDSMEQRRAFPRYPRCRAYPCVHPGLSTIKIKGRFTLRNGHPPWRLYPWRLIVCTSWRCEPCFSPCPVIELRKDSYRRTCRAHLQSPDL